MGCKYITGLPPALSSPVPFYERGSLDPEVRALTVRPLHPHTYTAVWTKVVPHMRKSEQDNAGWYYG